jgi:hypothetical protein
LSAPGRADFRAAVELAGLGDLPPDELALLRHYFDGWRAQVVQLRAVLELADEPATVFVAAPAAAPAGATRRGQEAAPGAGQ